MAENSSPPYCETTDLYLQLLGDAQRVEDQRVIRMVLRKLKNYGYSHGFGDADGDVIPFPGSTRRVADNDRCFLGLSRVVRQEVNIASVDSPPQLNHIKSARFELNR